MEQTVYIDLFFLINFSMDFLCFFLTSRLLSHKLSLKRTVAAAAVGGAYACVSLFLPLDGLWALLLDGAACVLMCAVAVLRRREIRATLTFAVVYTACSIVLGGFMTVLFLLFNRLGVDRLLGEGGDSDGVSVWLFALLALISGAVSLFGMRFFKKKSSRRSGEVELTLYGKSIILQALCDSGNLLTDPVSAKPCILAEKAELRRILPVGMVSAIEKGGYDDIRAQDMRRILVIPTETALGGGILYAVRMDRVRINMGKGWRDVDAPIVLCELNGADGAKALVPSELAFGAP